MISAVGQLAALPVPVLAVLVGIGVYRYRFSLESYLRQSGRQGTTHAEESPSTYASGCFFRFMISLGALMFVVFGLTFTIWIIIDAAT
jgi:hypothetical protein